MTIQRLIGAPVVVATLALLEWQGTAQAPPTSGDVIHQLNEGFVQVAENISRSVAVINVVQRLAPAGEDGDEDGEFEALPPGPLRRFHEQFKRPEKTRGEGSGVIIRENGFILTNRHVVQDAESIEVRLYDGRSFKAKLQGLDPQSDVAVIKIDAQGLPVAKMGDSAKTRVGEFAIAVGSPFSFDYSVTIGHVSAKGRANVVEGPDGLTMDQDFIQTDALINPGNSGGPLVNINGEVIGINTLIRGLHTGIGFAVPSNLARDVADQLIEHGKFIRPWLGIGSSALRDRPELREFVKGVEEGVVVSAILPQGPAAKSELRPGDIITAVDGQKVATPQQLRMSLRNKTIGQPVALDVVRKDKSLQLSLRPAEWVMPPAETVAKAKPAPHTKSEPAGLGITVQELTGELAERFGVDPSRDGGVLIASIDKSSPAMLNGLKPGDVITSVNLQPVSSKKEYDAAVKKADVAKGVLVNVISSKITRFEIIKSSGQ